MQDQFSTQHIDGIALFCLLIAIINKIPVHPLPIPPTHPYCVGVRVQYPCGEPNRWQGCPFSQPHKQQRSRHATLP